MVDEVNQVIGTYICSGADDISVESGRANMVVEGPTVNTHMATWWNESGIRCFG